MGSFSDLSWILAARTLVDHGLAELGESGEAPRSGPGSWADPGLARWYDIEQRDVVGARRHIEPVLERAERNPR